MNEPALQPAKRSILAIVFLSPSEPRLRAGWRIAIHSAGYNLLLICLTIPALIPVLLLGISPYSLWLNQAISVFAVTASVFLARRFLDRRTIASLGLRRSRWAILDLLAGIGITFVMMGLIFGIEWATGWLTFEGFAWQTEPGGSVTLAALGTFLLFIVVGWNEELLFRGYRLQNISDGLNPAWGVALSSAWFGIAHLLSPNASVISVTGIYLAGVFLAYAYLRTGQLWLSIGLHIGWNFFEGVAFGFPVSGLDIYSLTRIQVQGPELWTGGAFGPEAGLVILPAMLLGAGLIFLYTRKRDREDLTTS